MRMMMMMMIKILALGREIQWLKRYVTVEGKAPDCLIVHHISGTK